jgi:hypothetical protein
MKREDTPNALLTLDEKVTTANPAKDKVQEIGLRKFPIQLNVKM